MRSWVETLPDITARLDRGGVILDAGAGEGWSTIALANAFPEAHVVGFDLDVPSVEVARRHIADAGLSDRVSFVLRQRGRRGGAPGGDGWRRSRS